jgi:hypothetical protein
MLSGSCNRRMDGHRPPIAPLAPRYEDDGHTLRHSIEREPLDDTHAEEEP